MSSTRVLVAVVYHSGYGHTARQAEAVAIGAASLPNANSLLIRVEDIDRHWDTLEDSDAIIFGCPTYMGSASGEFKLFMDASSRAAFAQRRWQDKVAAGFTNAASRSGDKLGTLVQLAVFAAQQGMHWVNLGLPAGHNASTTSEDSLNRHGFFLGAGAQSDADRDAEAAAHPADLQTSQYLGRRVAEVAYQLAAGRLVISAP
ncbi:Multimeric flavodoxin WrbA [Cupriavidus sp. YR651]|uniref:flavodoxin family protein n=1 Tax=Cupriavidus sp. YR651 TaxID=1855315 RepID=UPI00088AFF92|nr:flavodoxin family protein [Cupriavidus sp. YR651]SDC61761.1 Multimeric flavodoxin WrbA [Cupriavidus sp. YR651]